MRRVRVIPVLLLTGNKVVKSIKFGKRTYIGDPINSVKLFNDKEVDELVILDIDATKEGRAPNLDKLHLIAGEAFMPVAYGGGITHVDQIGEILARGIEKVVINSSAIKDLDLISEGARRFGSQSVVASIDFKKDIFGKKMVFDHVRNKNTKIPLAKHVRNVESAGAGEIFLNSVAKDGTYEGYDINTIKEVSQSVDVPVIACGGASDIEDLYLAVSEGGASAVAAGSLFVLQKPHRAVLISFFDQESLKEKIFNRL